MEAEEVTTVGYLWSYKFFFQADRAEQFFWTPIDDFLNVLPVTLFEEFKLLAFDLWWEIMDINNNFLFLDEVFFGLVCVAFAGVT